MSKTKLRAGVVGGGTWLPKMYRRALRGNRVEIAACVASGDPDSAIAKGQECPDLEDVALYRTVGEMLEKEPDLHLVVVCSRGDAHLDQFTQVVQAGIPLAGEKSAFPFVSEMEAFDSTLTQLSRPLPILSCHMYPYHRVVQTVKWLLANRLDLFGYPWAWESDYLQDWLAYLANQSNWRLIPNQDPSIALLEGNAIPDIESHQRALAMELGFELSSVDFSRRWNTFNPSLLETNVQTAATFKFGGHDVRAIMVTDQTRIGHENDMGFKLCCQRATIQWRQQKPEYLIVDFGDQGKGRVEIHRGRFPKEIFGDLPPELGGEIPPGHPEGLTDASAYAFAAFEKDVRAYLEGSYTSPSPGYFNYAGARNIVLGNDAVIRSCNQGGQIML